MYGTEISSLSSTIAKCWKAVAGSAAGNVLLAALGDLARGLLPVLRPLPVKSKVTFGWPVPPAPLSKFCSGFLMSVPRSAGSSLRTYQRVGLRLGLSLSALLGADDDGARRDLDDLGARPARRLALAQLGADVGLALPGPPTTVLVFVVDEVVLRRVVAP